MVTGFFGMNFAREFSDLFFEGVRGPWAHYGAIAAVTAFVSGSMIFAVFLVVSNWADYRAILLPSKKRMPQESLRRTLELLEEEEEE
jgi:hypothetical protein